MKRLLGIFSKGDQTLLSGYNTGLLQGKANRVLNLHLSETLQPYELSVTEWKILGQLYEKKELQLSEIAEILDVEPPLITKLVDKMAEKNLVSKKVDRSDKRIKKVLISTSGKRLIPTIERKVQQKLKILLSGTTANDLRSYAKVLQIISANGA